MLVIAKYKENIDWSEGLEKIVYNKFKGKNKLDNIGREAHTFLYHIIKNYDTITDCVFCQGNPIEHVPDFILKLDNVKQGFYSFNVITIDNEIRADGIYRFGTKIESQEYRDLVVKILDIFGINKTWINSSYYGIFSVSKDRILRYSKEQYQRAFELSENELMPYAFEILWKTLFE